MTTVGQSERYSGLKSVIFRLHLFFFFFSRGFTEEPENGDRLTVGETEEGRVGLEN